MLDGLKYFGLFWDLSHMLFGLCEAGMLVALELETYNETPDCMGRHCLRRELKHHLAKWSLAYPMDHLQTTSGPYKC